MITVKAANGDIYKNFKEIEVSLDMDNLAGSFSIVSSVSKDNIFPFGAGDYIEILVDGEQVINGYIDKLDGMYSAGSHDIRIGGHSKIIDIVHSTVDPELKEFKEAISLDQIARKLLDDNKMESTKVINKVGYIKPFKKGEVSASVGETIFDFLEKLTRKRQLILNSDGDGNLLLTRGIGEESPTIAYDIFNMIGVEGNNILSASLKLDTADRYRFYKVHSNDGTIISEADIGLGGKANPSEGVENEAEDTDIRETRIFEIKAEESSSQAECENRAKWEKNIRKTRSLTYSATIQGHSGGINQEVYKINTVVRVVDDFYSLAEIMIIKKVVFEYSLSNGSTTTLDCILKDGYNIAATETKISDAMAKWIGEMMGVVILK